MRVKLSQAQLDGMLAGEYERGWRAGRQDTLRIIPDTSGQPTIPLATYEKSVAQAIAAYRLVADLYITEKAREADMAKTDREAWLERLAKGLVDGAELTEDNGVQFADPTASWFDEEAGLTDEHGDPVGEHNDDDELLSTLQPHDEGDGVNADDPY